MLIQSNSRNTTGSHHLLVSGPSGWGQSGGPLLFMNLAQLRQKLIEKELTFLPNEVLKQFGDSIKTVELEGIPGDIIETGVWRGGACIYAYHVMELIGSQRKLYLADSFEGLPKPNIEEYPADEGDPHWAQPHFVVGLEEVRANFQLFSPVRKGVVKFVPGWFSDTMPTLDIAPIAVLRLDGDMYESTMVVLEHLYPQLSPGGFCIIDDYGHKRAKKAVVDYRERNDITDPIQLIEHPGPYPYAFWRKT